MTDHSERIVILSDTHLGRPGRGARSASALRPLWRRAEQLILNGDVAELHDAACRAEAARQVLQLQELCTLDDVQITYLSGNHDPMLTDRKYLELMGGEVFVTHGDLLHPAISPWNTNAEHLRELNEDALRHLEAPEQQTFAGRAAAAQFASHRKWDEMALEPHKPRSKAVRAIDAAHKAARTVWFWHKLPQAAARFAREHAPRSRFFIFGHIHRSGIWRDGERVLINTGSYDFPSKPHGVVIQGGWLTVRSIHFTPDGYKFAREPVAVFDLMGQAAA